MRRVNEQLEKLTDAHRVGWIDNGPASIDSHGYIRIGDNRRLTPEAKKTPLTSTNLARTFPQLEPAESEWLVAHMQGHDLELQKVRTWRASTSMNVGLWSVMAAVAAFFCAVALREAGFAWAANAVLLCSGLILISFVLLFAARAYSDKLAKEQENDADLHAYFAGSPLTFDTAKSLAMKARSSRLQATFFFPCINDLQHRLTALDDGPHKAWCLNCRFDLHDQCQAEFAKYHRSSCSCDQHSERRESGFLDSLRDRLADFSLLPVFLLAPCLVALRVITWARYDPNIALILISAISPAKLLQVLALNAVLLLTAFLLAVLYYAMGLACREVRSRLSICCVMLASTAAPVTLVALYLADRRLEPQLGITIGMVALGLFFLPLFCGLSIDLLPAMGIAIAANLLCPVVILSLNDPLAVIGSLMIAIVVPCIMGLGGFKYFIQIMLVAPFALGALLLVLLPSPVLAVEAATTNEGEIIFQELSSSDGNTVVYVPSDKDVRRYHTQDLKNRRFCKLGFGSAADVVISPSSLSPCIS